MIGTAPSADVGTFLDVNGIRTFFMEQGDGEAVVMVHGAAPGDCSQVSWSSNVGPLANAGFWTIAYDQPGFGRSEPPADASLEGRVQHAKAFVDALGLTHYHLVGSADGAYVAARLALEDPGVDRLVLLSGDLLAPPGSADPTTWRSIAAQLPSLKPKTLILWGKSDTGAAVERALLLFDLIPGAELHVFGASGHAVQSDRAERFNTLVSDFLRA
jgi:pimeloyl-ACP methyl ester carboxylesterase